MAFNYSLAAQTSHMAGDYLAAGADHVGQFAVRHTACDADSSIFIDRSVFLGQKQQLFY